jgi:hypothetical protein
MIGTLFNCSSIFLPLITPIISCRRTFIPLC